MKIKIKNAPIYDAIKRHSLKNPVSFHMPGHKMGRGIPKNLIKDIIDMDITEISGMDNLHFPQGIIEEAMKLAAYAYGSDRTFFLVNGATCGIHAAIMSICRRGSKLIIARDCHKSVINSLILNEVEPIFIVPEVNQMFNIYTGITKLQVQEALTNNPDAVGVLLTRPTYYGVCYDIKEIADIVHFFGKVLIVDEAHGAHLKFSEKLPMSSIECGADICIHSAHKTLPALGQGAYMHIKLSNVNIDKIQESLRMIQTSSPSYVIMCFLDIVRDIMQCKGSALIDKLMENVAWFSKNIGNLDGIDVLSNQFLDFSDVDPTRIVVNVKKLGMYGFDVQQRLGEKHKIFTEMADIYNIVCITTIADADNLRSFEQLYNGIADIFRETKGRLKNNLLSNECEQRASIKRIGQFIRVMNPYEAFNFCKKKMKLHEAVGYVSGAMLVPYPPGTPIIIPGEIITNDVYGYINYILDVGGTIEGITEDRHIEVVDKKY